MGRAVSRRQQARRPIPSGLALARRVADRLVFSNVRRAFGGRLRFAVSGGAPLSPEVAGFFHAIGILIVEGYGLTESCPALTFNRIDDFKFGSVGQAIPGVELRIAAVPIPPPSSRSTGRRWPDSPASGVSSLRSTRSSRSAPRSWPG